MPRTRAARRGRRSASSRSSTSVSLPVVKRSPRASSDRAQLAVVVDLAVEDDPVPAVRRRHRLRAGRAGIDDREPGVDQQRRPARASATRRGRPDRGAPARRRAPRTDPAQSRRRGAPHRQCRTSEEPRLRILISSLGSTLSSISAGTSTVLPFDAARTILMRRSDPRSVSPPARMIACATVVPVSSTNDPGFLTKPEM